MNLTEPITPNWVRDAVFYQIFPDRFAQSERVAKPSGLKGWGSPPTPHGYQGGDLLGVAENLDTLVDLGINAIYFTPIFQSASNHRYHTHDYLNVDPMLGGNQAFRELLDRAHDRGMKIVLDGVFNHASRGFFQFNDILENGSDSAYTDWFHVEDYPLFAYDPEKPNNYKAWWGLSALPKFRTETPAVREYLLHVAQYWIDLGIDGWRLDVPEEIDDDDFWRTFRRRVKEHNPEAYIVGEIWGDGSRWLQGDMFDSVMNYILAKACISFFIGDSLNRNELAPEPLKNLHPANARQFASEIANLQSKYHPNIQLALLNLLGSHDTARFLTLAGEDRSAIRLATLFLMTYPGAPCVYYGDEVGMTGGHEPGSRGAFPWHRSLWDHELRDTFRTYIHLRHSHPSLRRGSYETLLAEGHVYAFLRQFEGESVVVILNAGTSGVTVDLDFPGLSVDGVEWSDALGSGASRVEEGRLRGLDVDARSGRVLVTREGQ
ncbi:glycoside hydrolase family 13 protein [Tautonia marina]|uniref:glycoside hydrolase family 13 protein n=1 Tax=Tautonia marina TaxID=2653855 RepID=UPI001EE9D6E9|nr:glycoside hydrolase family 13 protein [Tautonia marina]